MCSWAGFVLCVPTLSWLESDYFHRITHALWYVYTSRRTPPYSGVCLLPKDIRMGKTFFFLLSLSVSCLGLFSPLFLSLIRLPSLSTSLYFPCLPSLSLMSASIPPPAPWLITAVAVIVSLLCQCQGEDPGDKSPPIRRQKHCPWGFWGDLIPNIFQAVSNTAVPSTAATNLARSHVFRARRRGTNGARDDITAGDVIAKGHQSMIIPVECRCSKKEGNVIWLVHLLCPWHLRENK